MIEIRVSQHAHKVLARMADEDRRRVYRLVGRLSQGERLPPETLRLPKAIGERARGAQYQVKAGRKLRVYLTREGDRTYEVVDVVLRGSKQVWDSER